MMESSVVSSAAVLSLLGDGKEKECAMAVEEAALSKLSVSAPNVPRIQPEVLAVKDKLLEQVPNVEPSSTNTGTTGAGEEMDTSGTTAGGSASEKQKEVRITESGLNALVMGKIAAVFACDGDREIVKLKDKILEFNQSKDKVAQKLITMQKQIDELNRAVVENSEHMANPTDGPPAPLKFFRSVGLQVNSETRAQVSLQNSATIRGSKEAAMPFKRNGALVGPASVKRNYTNKMAGGEVGVSVSAVPPTKRLTTSPIASASRTSVGNDVVELDDEVKMEVGSTTNGSTTTPTGVVKTSPRAQGQGQGAVNVPYRPVAPNVRPIAPRGAGPTAIRSVAPRPATAGTSTRLQFGGHGQQTKSRFVLPPLPPSANNNNTPRPDGLVPPPRPQLTLKGQTDGIVLSWQHPMGNNNADITNYQIFACQESLQGPSKGPAQWKRVGDVKALPLPMACTLSQFTAENRYYFIVRGVDVFNRTGPFCEPASIVKRRSAGESTK